MVLSKGFNSPYGNGGIVRLYFEMLKILALTHSYQIGDMSMCSMRFFEELILCFIL